MTERLPIIYSAHHASCDFGEFSDRTNLTKEERVRFSDYGTSETVPTNGILTLRSEYSRGVIDLNRGLGDPNIFPIHDFSSNPKKIWREGQELTKQEQERIVDTVWLPYHDQILQEIRKMDGPGLVVGWDNTAHKIIYKDIGYSVEMKPFILSNNGALDSTKPDPKSKESTTCEPEFLEEFAHEFKKELGNRGIKTEVYFNHYLKGRYIVRRYNTNNSPDLSEHKIQSFQIEYDTILTHDQETLESYRETIIDIKESFEDAISKMY